MSRLIIFVVIGLIIWATWSQYTRLPKERRRHFLGKCLLWGLLGLILVLVATGRVHWIAAAIAASLPILKGLFALVLRGFPFLQLWLKNRQGTAQQPPPTSTSQMSREEAYQTLGLQPGASREDITQAHKRLMQKLHPDRGGNDFLAAKLNSAKDLLLDK